MLDKRFLKIILFIHIILFVLILAFSYLNLNEQSVIKSYEYSNKSMRLSFNRIINPKSVKVSIIPEIKFNTYVKGKNVVISFVDNPISDTEYLLHFDTIKDQYNTDVVIDRKISFKTDVLKYTYLKDRSEIIETSISGKDSMVLITDKDIREFTRSGKYLAYVTGKGYGFTQKVFLVDTETNLKLEITPNENTLNKNLSLSANGNELSFISQLLVIDKGEITSIRNNKLYTYYTNEKKLVDRLPAEDTDVWEIEYTKIGNTLLYRSSDSTYLLFDGTTQTPLSKHFGTGGFNRDSSIILFVDSDNTLPGINSFISIYDKNRESNPITSMNVFQIDPRFYNNSDKVIYSNETTDFNSDFPRYDIREVINGKESILFTDNIYSLELPTPSPDDKYISVESYSDKDKESINIDSRDFMYQVKPYQGKIRIYNLENKTLVKEFEGINLVWNSSY